MFSNLGWVLCVVGIVVALFEFAIESQSGRGDPKTLSLNIIKGFFAVNLFSVVPVQLYSLAV
ncbi:conjugal transfer protein TrbL family protein, partial [Salmonella enterica]|uniref:conjugal transfer protein TrbL family protein n=1 Tax=Salmonella enterica TaxID=28901 RepID=UPI003D768F88